MSRFTRIACWSALTYGVMWAFAAFAAPVDDAKIVADLDTEYQAAVERDDWQRRIEGAGGREQGRALGPDGVIQLLRERF